MSEQTFWMEKLAAFLHDPPNKCLDIGGHGKNADAFLAAAGFTDAEEREQIIKKVKYADHFDAAAQRFGFPKDKCSATFAENPARAFVHPLSSAAIAVRSNLVPQAGAVHETLQTAIMGIESDDWRSRFFLYWRRWQENASSVDPDLAFLAADTRIPDHSIWTHMTLASAVAGCGGKPTMLLFQLGPVQDFIAQARSTRDLWSGSYLISWLMAHAMKAVSDAVGPDAIIFPNLRGNGIFDALHKDTIYSTRWADGKGGHDTTWDRIKQEKGGDAEVATWLLTPTLPNRFLALVPESRAAELAQAVEAAVHTELARIGDAVWAWLQKKGTQTTWKARWDAQLAAFPQTAWAIQPWLTRETCLAETEKLPDTGVAERLKAVFALAEEKLPKDDRDERYYNADKTRLKNPGLLWSAHYALVDAKLAARRNTRDFAAWVNPTPDASVKDSLSGKDECIGSEEFWKSLSAEPLFNKASGHRYGAMNLIKRLWCRMDEVPYLSVRLGLSESVISGALRTDSTEEIANNNIRDRDPATGKQSSPSPYIAVLALDGDEIGKWVSGEKTPLLLEQLAPKARGYLKTLSGADTVKRLLTPSYHLQFSEALANFAIWKAGVVVTEHDGELIYAGGDDVLAILPSTRAIACAEALRTAFRTDREKARLYPGSKCEVSVGIAIGHQNAPLQMLVREAQKAEKRAKGLYGRAALAISLYKRSGETIEWGCTWKSKALDLMREITTLNTAGKLSGRFPYALAALLQPYALEDEKDAGKLAAMRPVIEAEVRHVLSRQGSGLSGDERKALACEIDAWLAVCWSPPPSASGVRRPGSQPEDAGPRTQAPERQAPQPRPQDFINLFLAETFINRLRGEN